MTGQGPWYDDGTVMVFHGDSRVELKKLPDASIDAVVTDPPYELTAGGKTGFMGARWDGTGVAFDPAVWAECLRVLKPGGHLAAFGAPRTYHRMAVAIEDAGFVISDSLMWVRSGNMPKSKNVSVAINKETNRPRVAFGTSGPDQVPVTAPASPEAAEWEGWGTALASAYEPVVLARRPREGTVAQNVLAYRTGGINIDGCRVPYETNGTTASNPSLRTHINDGNGSHVIATETDRRVVVPHTGGRWPSNLLLSHTMADDGTDGCADGCADECAVREMDTQSGTLTSGILKEHHHRNPKQAGVLGAYGAQPGARGYGDTGGASRFFPVFRYEAKAAQHERPEVDGVRHVSVKPLSMMRWIVKLLTPPGGTVLDLFAGTGTTGEACVVESFRCILVESEAAHLPLIRQRLGRPIQPDLFGGAA